MIFSQTNRTEADKVFVVGKNNTATTTPTSAHTPVEWDCVSLTDGHAFTAAKSAGAAGLFAGIVDASSISGDDGVLIQVYGFRQSAYVSQVSAAIAAGALLMPVSGTLRSGTTGSVAAGFNFLTLMDSTSAKSAGTIDTFGVFIRAM